MSEFPYYGTSIGKHRQLPLPENVQIPITWKYFCGNPYHSQTTFFFLKKYGNIYFQFMENRWVHVFPTHGSVEIFLMEKINFVYFMCNRKTTRKFSGQVRFPGLGAFR